MLGDIVGGLFHVTAGHGGDGRGPLDHVRQLLGRGGAQRLVRVARGKDVDDHHLIGIGEGARELVEEEGGAAVHVRLEDRPQTSLPHHLAHGSQGGAHLGRMVRVVVVDDHAGSIGDQLHPPSGSSEGPQALRQRVERGAQLMRQGDGRGGVQDVVRPCQRRFERMFE